MSQQAAVLQRPQELFAVHSRHQDVAQDEIELVLIDQGERRFAVRRDLEVGMPFRLEPLPEDVTLHRFVVDN